MACVAHPASPSPAPPVMDRCECAEISFADLVRRMRDESLAFEELSVRTGCGRTCTACLPDLRRYLGLG